MYKLTIKEKGSYHDGINFYFEGMTALTQFLESALDADIDNKYTYKVSKVEGSAE